MSLPFLAMLCKNEGVFVLYWFRWDCLKEDRCPSGAAWLSPISSNLSRVQTGVLCSSLTRNHIGDFGDFCFLPSSTQSRNCRGGYLFSWVSNRIDDVLCLCVLYVPRTRSVNDIPHQINQGGGDMLIDDETFDKILDSSLPPYFLLPQIFSLIAQRLHRHCSCSCMYRMSYSSNSLVTRFAAKMMRK